MGPRHTEQASQQSYISWSSMKACFAVYGNAAPWILPDSLHDRSCLRMPEDLPIHHQSWQHDNIWYSLTWQLDNIWYQYPRQRLNVIDKLIVKLKNMSLSVIDCTLIVRQAMLLLTMTELQAVPWMQDRSPQLCCSFGLRALQVHSICTVRGTINVGWLLICPRGFNSSTFMRMRSARLWKIAGVLDDVTTSIGLPPFHHTGIFGLAPHPTIKTSLGHPWVPRSSHRRSTSLVCEKSWIWIRHDLPDSWHLTWFWFGMAWHASTRFGFGLRHVSPVSNITTTGQAASLWKPNRS